MTNKLRPLATVGRWLGATDRRLVDYVRFPDGQMEHTKKQSFTPRYEGGQR